MNSDERIVRLPLEVELVRRIDRLILSGAGGFETRTEFFREAALTLLDEYAHSGGPGRRDFDELVDVADAPSVTTEPIAMDETILWAPAQPGLVLGGSVATVKPQMLFGLHNRDYPSLWALRHLADIAGSELRDLDECLRLVTAEAWRFGARLLTLEAKVGQKLTALFPTNPSKRQSADNAFRNFAIGGCGWTGAGLIAVGPLFEWMTCGVTSDPANRAHVQLGVTDAGYALLHSVDGISLRLPHERAHAEAFLDHLRHHDPADLSGFEFVATVLRQEVTREELVDAFAGRLTDRQDQASTYAAGYVARAREWGLVAPKQHEGRYVLTTYGEEFASKVSGVAK